MGKFNRDTRCAADPSPAADTDAVEPAGEFLDETDRLKGIIERGNRTDATAVGFVAEVLANLRRLEDVTSAAAVRPSVLQQQHLAAALAANSTAGVRRKAVGLLSEICQYLGWLNIPDKRWAEAHTSLDRATTLAIEVDDPVRLSTALSFLSYSNLRRGNSEAAAALNEAASRDERTHVGLRTYLAFQRAEIAARSGARNQALNHLRDADRLTDDLPPEAELPDSGYWYTSGFFHGQRAFVLDALGDATQAKRTAAEALAMLPDSWRDSEWAARRRKLAEID